MRSKPLDYEQLQQFFGIILAMTIANCGENEAYGGQSQIFSTPALGQYMSLNHCDTLLRNLRLCQYSEDDLKEDPWYQYVVQLSH